MKTVISRQSQFLDWIGDVNSASEVREVARTAREKVVFSGDYSRRDFQKLLLTVEKPGVQSLLEAFLSEASFVVNTEIEDFEDDLIKNREFDSFTELIRSEELDSAIRIHTEAMKVGESRQHGFDRLIAHLLAGVEMFEFIDPFIGDKILEDSPVVKWFLEEVNKKSKCSIRIVTRFPRRDFRKDTDVFSELTSKIEKLQSQLPSACSMFVDFFEKMPHNRYLHLKLLGGSSIYASVDHGIDAFLTDPVSELEPVKPLTANEISSIRSSTKWKPGRTDKSGLTQLYSKAPSEPERLLLSGPARLAP